MNIGLILILIVLITIALVECSILFFRFCIGIWKYFLCQERNLQIRYGPGSWVVITGPSSGQGRQFALGFAQRGFNLLLLGSARCSTVMEEIRKRYPRVQMRYLMIDFGRAFEDNFFDMIEKEIMNLGKEVSILVNNVGHRTGWISYETMPAEFIRETISCCTIVQARLTQIMISIFLKRQQKSAIINVTTQCLHPTLGWGMVLSNDICLPYLSVYEASKAFGFYHANSLQKEFGGRLDILNITPGAVITENTPYLKNTWCSIDCKKFVQNIFRLLGNVQGTTCAYWGHALSAYLINLFPWRKKKILFQTGKLIAENYMRTYHLKTYRGSPQNSEYKAP